MPDPHLIYGNLDFPKLPAGWEDTPPGGVYAIDFVGERSKYDRIIVDRLVSIREVEPPPPGQMPPDKAKAIVADYFERCKGVKVCMPNSVAVNWRNQHPG
jgi:hypothetical protein